MMKQIAWMMLIGLAGCGGGGASDAGGPAVPREPLPVEASFARQAVVKLRATQDAVAVLLERVPVVVPLLTPLTRDRELELRSGAAAPVRYAPPAGWNLIDFALHPSGQVTLVLSDGAALRLVRLSARAEVLREAAFADPAVATDPAHLPGVDRGQCARMAPWKTRDAVRIAPAGESLALLLRGGCNALVAYRLELAAGGGYSQRWRTLVEPGVHLDAIGLTSGSFDPFGGMDNHWQVFMDVDSTGRIAVATSASRRTELPHGHASHFGEPFPASFADGFVLTLLGHDGARLGSAIVPTAGRSELQVVRWAGDSVLAGGRVLSARRDDGAGWDALLVQVAAATRQVQATRPIDVDRGDVIFDILPLSAGTVLLAGSTGYTQNPNGESVSEATLPLLVRYSLSGGGMARIALAQGARGNQVRSLAVQGQDVLIGAMRNTAGTHSADADLQLLYSDGYLQTLQMLNK